MTEEELEAATQDPEEMKRLGSSLLSGKGSRVSNMGAAFWVALAAGADLFSLIPFVGDISGPVFWVCASIYLWKKGCGLINARRLAATLISMVAEMIPAIQEFPITILGIVVVIALIRLEDRTGLGLMKKITNPVSTNRPMYNGGVRMSELQRKALEEKEQTEALNSSDGIRRPRPTY